MKKLRIAFFGGTFVHQKIKKNVKTLEQNAFY